MSIQKRPAVRHIQPMGFLGRLEAIKAPTKGKARKGTNSNRPPTAAQVLEGRVSGAPDKDKRVSTTPATNIVRESPASAQASQEAARDLIPPAPRSCSASPSLTTPLYFLDLLGANGDTLLRHGWERQQVARSRQVRLDHHQQHQDGQQDHHHCCVPPKLRPRRLRLWLGFSPKHSTWWCR